MKYLLLSLLLISQTVFGVTAGKVWRVAPGATVGSWGAVNLADTTNAVTGILPLTNLASATYGISSATTTFSTSSASFVDVTDAGAVAISVTITTHGKPVIVGLTHSGSGSFAFGPFFSGSGLTDADYQFLLDGSTMGINRLYGGGGSSFSGQWTAPPTQYHVPSAGSHTFKIQVRNSGSGQMYVQSAKLFAYELFGN